MGNSGSLAQTCANVVLLIPAVTLPNSPVWSTVRNVFVQGASTTTWTMSARTPTSSLLNCMRKDEVLYLEDIWVVHVDKLRHFSVTHTIVMDLCTRATLASIPGRTSIREVGLVSTACACANIPPVSGGFG